MKITSYGGKQGFLTFCGHFGSQVCARISTRENHPSIYMSVKQRNSDANLEFSNLRSGADEVSSTIKTISLSA